MDLEKEIKKENATIARIEKAVDRVERARDKSDKKAENRALKRFEKLADRELFGYEKTTRRDFL